MKRMLKHHNESSRVTSNLKNYLWPPKYFTPACQTGISIIPMTFRSSACNTIQFMKYHNIHPPMQYDESWKPFSTDIRKLWILRITMVHSAGAVPQVLLATWSVWKKTGNVSSIRESAQRTKISRLLWNQVMMLKMQSTSWSVLEVNWRLWLNEPQKE